MATPAPANRVSPNNSFSITRSGARKAVLDALKNDKARPADSDQSQVEATKTLIADQIGRLGEEFNGCQVIAGGELGPGRSAVTVQVFGTKLDL